MWSFKVLVFVVLAINFIVSSENSVICYYGSWATYRYGNGKFDVQDINPHLCTHLIYAFAGIDDQGHIKSLDPWLDLPDNWGRDNFGKFNALKQKNPSLRTLLAVGGWNEGSAKYSIMAGNPIYRKNFIDSAIKILTHHGFDGLDIDWEYPNDRDTVHGKEDVNNFTKLLRELKDAINGTGLMVTAAVIAIGDKASASYDIVGISKYLDIVNIMTYDMYGPWDDVTGHNAPLHKGYEGDTFTVEQALQYWIGAGCPPEKIALGIPFYGHSYSLSNSNVNGVRAPSNGPGLAGPYTATAGMLGYIEICEKLQTESWTKRFDAISKVPYAFKNSDWISYDDTNSIAIKIDYAKGLGVTNIMIWSIETDDFHGVCGVVYPLLKAINKALDIEDITTNNPNSGNSVSSSTDNSVISSSISPIVTTSSPKVFTCEQQGFAANPVDCSSFYSCVGSPIGVIAYKFQCPAGLYWSQSIMSCDYRNLVKCDAT